MKDTEIIALVDEKLDERFRKMALRLESLENEVKWSGSMWKGVDASIKRLAEELTLPSGKITQGFSSLREQLEQLLEKATPSAAMKRKR